MEQGDKARLLDVLQAVYDLYGKDLSEMVGGIWWETMKPYDLAAVKDAFNRYAVGDQGQFVPKPADIVKLMAGSTQDGALMAWTKVQKAVHEIGCYKTVCFDDQIINAVLTDMGGWPGLGMVQEDELPFKAKEFETRYRGYKTRGRLAAWPAALPGIVDMGNGAKGLPMMTPELIGDHTLALKVLSSGSSGGLVAIEQHLPKLEKRP